MQIIATRQLKNGRTRVTMTLERGEVPCAHPAGTTRVTIDESQYYKLGYPMSEDVIHGSILAQARQTQWCSLTQKWVE